MLIENVASDDHMARPRIQEALRIVGANASADVQATRKSAQGFERRRFVAASQHDDMPAGETIVPIARRVRACAVFAHEVFLRSRAFVAQGGADDLLDLAL